MVVLTVSVLSIISNRRGEEKRSRDGMSLVWHATVTVVLTISSFTNESHDLLCREMEIDAGDIQR